MPPNAATFVLPALQYPRRSDNFSAAVVKDISLQSFFVWIGVEGGKDVVVHSIMELGELLS